MEKDQKTWGNNNFDNTKQKYLELLEKLNFDDRTEYYNTYQALKQLYETMGKRFTDLKNQLKLKQPKKKLFIMLSKWKMNQKKSSQMPFRMFIRKWRNFRS